MLNKEFKIKRLELVRDMFLFSCFTGLAYIDVYNLTKSNIIIGIDGEKWISTHRQKTESASKIPILPLTQMIIHKYVNHTLSNNQERLPQYFIQPKNECLFKKMADINQINKELTFILLDIISRQL